MSQFNGMHEETMSQGTTFFFTEAYGAQDASMEAFRDTVFFSVAVLLAAGSAALLALGRASSLMASVESALRAL